MNTNAIQWFEIYVDDIARAKTFYETVLAQTLTRIDTPEHAQNFPQPEMWAFEMSDGPGASGALCKMQGVAAGGNSTLVYFECQDCANEQARVTAAGGQLMVPKMAIGEHGFIAIAQDTEGNNIGFHSTV